jgi:uncharacterized protein YjbI with pentapeptide repeats
MKTMIQTLSIAVIAASAAGSLAMAAPARSEAGFENTPGKNFNGRTMNGIRFNGAKFNTVRFNGFSLNGNRFNGAALTGAKAQGPILACDADKADICKPGVVAVTLASGQRLILD